MRRSTFRRLVNLYLDGEISPADRERLRRVLTSDEGLRREFRAYQRMDRAAGLVLRQPAASPLAGGACGQEARTRPASIRILFPVAGGVLAACLMLAILALPKGSGPPSSPGLAVRGAAEAPASPRDSSPNLVAVGSEPRDAGPRIGWGDVLQAPAVELARQTRPYSPVAGSGLMSVDGSRFAGASGSSHLLAPGRFEVPRPAFQVNPRMVPVGTTPGFRTDPSRRASSLTPVLFPTAHGFSP